MTELYLFHKDRETDPQKRDDQQKDRKNHHFRLGFVMAGAISAGAYTAGVMDFIVEALQKWYAKRDSDPDSGENTYHKVTIDVLGGASAGGMCAGIFASALRDYQPGTNKPTPQPDVKNVFYKSWVIDVHYKAMVTTTDLRKNEPPNSALNIEGEDSLMGIRERALGVDGTDQDYPEWLAHPLPIMVTLGNTRGVPFALHFNALNQYSAKHGMLQHADHLIFSLSSDGTERHENARPLKFKFKGYKGDANWEEFGQATLATGAFPGAFAPQMITRPPSDYDNRWISVANQSGPPSWHQIKPAWPGGPDDPFQFYSIDGGTFNNEPMELVRRALADHTGRNERDIKKATRMVVMVDPFPEGVDYEEDWREFGTLTGSLLRILTAFKGQSRLKVEDLALFGNRAVGSRFIIAPTSDRNRRRPLACGSVGAFGGLLKREWRHHDYLLGRLNAQKFLSDVFVVPQDHEALNGVSFRQLSSSGNVRIIPLVDGMDDPGAAVEGIGQRDARGTPNYQVPWPEGLTRSEIDDIAGEFHARLKAVLKAQFAGNTTERSFFGKIGSFFKGIATAILAGPVLLYINSKSKKKLADLLAKQLEGYDLLKR